MAGGKAKANLEAPCVEEARQRLVDMVAVDLGQNERGLLAECLQYESGRSLCSGSHC